MVTPKVEYQASGINMRRNTNDIAFPFMDLHTSHFALIRHKRSLDGDKFQAFYSLKMGDIVRQKSEIVVKASGSNKEVKIAYYLASL